MKTWSLTPILTSAYLSAMLTSGLAPIRPSVIFAAAIDPMAAQKALQTAASAMTTDGWAVPAAATLPPLTPQASPSIQQPKTDPVMTAELMARMIKFTEGQTLRGAIPGEVCALFKLCDGTAKMSVKQIQTENPEGHFFMIPAIAGSTDYIVASRNPDSSVDYFLTDKNYKLRAAALDSDKIRSVPIEKAAEKFKIALSLFAKEASDLPPTGTAVAGNG